MSEQSTIHYERTSPQIAKITFANPPVNLIVGETVLRLIEIVDRIGDRPGHPGRACSTAPSPTSSTTTSTSPRPPTSPPPRRGRGAGLDRTWS